MGSPYSSPSQRRRSICRQRGQQNGIDLVWTGSTGLPQVGQRGEGIGANERIASRLLQAAEMLRLLGYSFFSDFAVAGALFESLLGLLSDPLELEFPLSAAAFCL